MAITSNLPMYHSEIIHNLKSHNTKFGYVVVIETNMRDFKTKRPMYHYTIKVLDTQTGEVSSFHGRTSKHFTDACSYARVLARKKIK